MDCREGFESGRGVTLIELMVVIAILAILVVLAVANYQGQEAKARDARRKDDLQRIVQFFEEYQNDNQTYPIYSSSSDRWAMPACGVTPCGRGRVLVCGQSVPNYSFKIPCDPINSSINNKYYYYIYFNDHEEGLPDNGFRLYTHLENSSDPSIEAVGCSKNGCTHLNTMNYGVTSGGSSL